LGLRVFDVLLEGDLAVDDLDIYSQVGAETALVVSVPVTVTDGQLNIQFIHGVENPKISAIEVVSGSAPTTGFHLRVADVGTGMVYIGFPELKPVGDYHLYGFSDLSQIDLSDPANRIDTITKAQVEAMTPAERAQTLRGYPMVGPRRFFKLELHVAN
jgi:hypothetical protein